MATLPQWLKVPTSVSVGRIFCNLVSLAVTLALFVATTPQVNAATRHVVAFPGMDSPDGVGVIDWARGGFGGGFISSDPVLSDGGHVVFRSNLANASVAEGQSGIFLYSPDEQSLDIVMRQFQLTPDANGNPLPAGIGGFLGDAYFSRFTSSPPYSVSPAGHVAFVSDLEETVPAAFDSAIYLYSDGKTFEVAREGSQFSDVAETEFYAGNLNSSGEFVFTDRIQNDRWSYLYANGTVQEIVSDGSPHPTAETILDHHGDPIIFEDGKVLFTADTPGHGSQGLFQHADGSLSQLVGKQSAIPGGVVDTVDRIREEADEGFVVTVERTGEPFLSVYSVTAAGTHHLFSQNDVAPDSGGNFMFTAVDDFARGGAALLRESINNEEGLFYTSPTGTHLVAQVNDWVAPNWDARFASLNSPSSSGPHANDAGNAVFSARVNPLQPGVDDYFGIFTWNENDAPQTDVYDEKTVVRPTELLRIGQPSVELGGVVRRLEDFRLNADNQLLLVLGIDSSFSNTIALYDLEQASFEVIAQVGEEFDEGVTVAGIDVTTVQFNDAGHVLFEARTEENPQFSILLYDPANGQAGDNDGDGDVDGKDLVVWQRSDGTQDGLADWMNAYPLYDATNGPSGDYEGDGDVDGKDFVEWQRSDATEGGLADWGDAYSSVLPVSSSGNGAVAQVPESSSLVSCLGVLLCRCSRSRARRQHNIQDPLINRVVWDV